MVDGTRVRHIWTACRPGWTTFRETLCKLWRWYQFGCSFVCPDYQLHYEKFGVTSLNQTRTTAVASFYQLNWDSNFFQRSQSFLQFRHIQHNCGKKNVQMQILSHWLLHTVTCCFLCDGEDNQLPAKQIPAMRRQKIDESKANEYVVLFRFITASRNLPWSVSSS